MVLVRWDPRELPTPFNLVLVQQSVAALIEASPTGGVGVESFDAEVIDRVRGRLLWAKEVCDGAWPPRSDEDTGGGTLVRAEKVRKERYDSWVDLDTVVLGLGSLSLFGLLVRAGVSSYFKK
jgi:hypothetical protein